MNFTKMNLKEYLVEGISSSNNLATNAEAKASEQATTVSNPRQHSPERKNMQLKQRSARTGHTQMSNTVDLTPTAPRVAESFSNTFKKIQKAKMYEAAKSDWRKELAEAVNPDDEPDHPYVEIMPHFKYKEKEAKKNTAKAAIKDRANTGKRAIGAPVNESNT